MIPILIIPCKDSQIILKNIHQQKKDFFAHIIKCNECEIINNNVLFITKKKFVNCLIGKIIEKNIINELNAYYNLKKYIDKRYFCYNILYVIDDVNSKYNNCCLIIKESITN